VWLLSNVRKTAQGIGALVFAIKKPAQTPIMRRIIAVLPRQESALTRLASPAALKMQQQAGSRPAPLINP